jgi:hypothetical protein
VSDVAERVARGAAWLDQKYPQWYAKIDLGTLDLGNCTQCVLGQVYSGVIPQAEQGQVLAQAIAQVTAGYPDAGEWETEYLEEVALGNMGGYQILTDFHELPDEGMWHGFVAPADSSGDTDREKAEYAELLDYWTRAILRRRLAAGQNAVDPELRELVSIV